MSTATLPRGAEPNNIGKVVTIQVFRLETNNADLILPETLEKYVGVLESYRHDKRGFMFQLVGGERVSTSYTKQHVEIFVADIRGQ